MKKKKRKKKVQVEEVCPFLAELRDFKQIKVTTFCVFKTGMKGIAYQKVSS